MFLRRGVPSHSIVKSLLSTALSSTATGQNSIRPGFRIYRSTFSNFTARTLHSTRYYRQYAGTLQREEDDATDSPKTQKENGPKRSSMGSRIDAASQLGPVTKFHELAERQLVSPVLVETLTRDMKLETMTDVQSLTINQTLKGVDVLAQARTGTGKTLAFLIPVIQNIIEYDPKLEKRRSSQMRESTAATDIRAIIISPTRELAEQIALEAGKLVSKTNIIVQTAVGGSQKSFHLNKMRKEGCHILVGTPGRLNDLLSDPYSRVRAPNLSAFVLDEADRLLDQGFAPEIADIQRLLPNRKEVDRQTLLFSATVPREVMDIVRRTTKPDFKFVRTVQEGESQTHDRVPQKLVYVKGFENLLPSLLELCQREIKAGIKPFKAIAYFNATAEATLAASTFRNLPGGRDGPLSDSKIIEIHGKLTQGQRTNAADQFKRARSAILFSSDVTARGMDFPNVTHVIQIGIPVSRDTYVHRIGRTARADKEGEGWLFATPIERIEIRHRLKLLPLNIDTSIESAKVDMTQDAELPESIALNLTQIMQASSRVPTHEKSAAYMASLGIFQWLHDKQSLIDAMNGRAKYQWAMDLPPPVSHGIVQKLGLSRVMGLNIGSNTEPRSVGRPTEQGFGRSGNDRHGAGGPPRRFTNDRRDSRYNTERSSTGGGYGGRPSGDGYGGRTGSSYGSRSSGSSGSRYGGERGSDRGSYGDRSRSSFGSRGTERG